MGGWATFFSCIGPDWGLWEYNFLIDLEWSWAGDSNEKIKKVPPVIGSRDMSWRNWFLDNPKNIQKLGKIFKVSKSE